jgi:hypothetical protein
MPLNFGIVRNLMYGFGDDRNPANDTVNVMEEILVEYIVDVVSFAAVIFRILIITHHCVVLSAKLLWRLVKSLD